LPGKCVWISVLFLEGGIEPPPNEKVREHPNDEVSSEINLSE
jgi:hypothetical protein